MKGKLLGLLLLMAHLSWSQKIISGSIIDSLTNEALFGVVVMAKGTSIGTMTDLDGRFELEIPDHVTFLDVSMIGYKSLEVEIKEQHYFELALEEDVVGVDEVAVTSVGIKREQKKLGYAVQEVSGDNVQQAKESNIINALSGKVAGVQITNSSGSVGASSHIEIRGASSLNGSYNNGTVRIVQSQNLSSAPKKKGNRKSRKEAKTVHPTIATKVPVQNAEPIASEQYKGIPENKFKEAVSEPLSTFSIDVDRASYGTVKRYLEMGQIPPVNAIRVEELINYFSYEDKAPEDNEPFAISSEVGACPWNKDHYLMRVGMKGKVIADEDLPAQNLVFLVDVSGSMSDHNKLPLVKENLKMLTTQMREQDHISIVVYAGAAGLVLEPTNGDNKQRINQAINRLSAGGSTAGGAGIQLAYATAKKHFKKGGNNRIVLATDGDFNVGIANREDLGELVKKERESGVYLTVMGYGMGNYRDDFLEVLADKGNGNYAYINDLYEAQKFLIDEFKGTMVTIAKDVKLQVEFNPQLVAKYKLIGYENRMLKTEDFEDDKKDAGEMGMGHSVVALYEVMPVGAPGAENQELRYSKAKFEANESHSDEIAFVKWRYKHPKEDKSVERQKAVSKSLSETQGEDWLFSSAVAAFGLKLRGTQGMEDMSFKQIKEMAQKSKGKDENGYRGDFIKLVKLAGSIHNVNVVDDIARE